MVPTSKRDTGGWKEDTASFGRGNSVWEGEKWGRGKMVVGRKELKKLLWRPGHKKGEEGPTGKESLNEKFNKRMGGRSFHIPGGQLPEDEEDRGINHLLREKEKRRCKNN